MTALELKIRKVMMQHSFFWFDISGIAGPLDPEVGSEEIFHALRLLEARGFIECDFNRGLYRLTATGRSEPERT